MFGLKTLNNNNEILISNNISTLHFHSKIILSNGSFDKGDFPTYTGAKDTYPEGITTFSFNVYTNACPVIFIKPNSDYPISITDLHNSGAGSWQCVIKVLGECTATPPVIYIFSNPSECTSRGDYGLRVFDKTSALLFDSTRRPLQVLDAGSVSSPEIPCNSGEPYNSTGYSWNYNTLDWDFGCKNVFNTSTINNLPGVPARSMMIHFSSNAQGVYKRQIEGYKKSCGTFHTGCQEHWSTAMWWASYRSGLTITADGKVKAGWTIQDLAYTFSSNSESGGWFGGGGSSTSEGTMPFPQSTINSLTASYIVADSRLYD